MQNGEVVGILGITRTSEGSQEQWSTKVIGRGQ